MAHAYVAVLMICQQKTAKRLEQWMKWDIDSLEVEQKQSDLLMNKKIDTYTSAGKFCYDVLRFHWRTKNLSLFSYWSTWLEHSAQFFMRKTSKTSQINFEVPGFQWS